MEVVGCGLGWSFFFFFQAEDGIRDHCVTGVQTCALPIFTVLRLSVCILEHDNMALVSGIKRRRNSKMSTRVQAQNYVA